MENWTGGMVFRDRADAGRRLRRRLEKYGNRRDVMVLGIPRGGVAVAFEVAKELGLGLDVFVSRKLGVPGQEELAFGAITGGGVRVLNRHIVDVVGISEAEIERIAARVLEEVEGRERVYRGAREALAVAGKTVIVVDDGVATGASMEAAIEALRQMKPAWLVVAVPVASVAACERLQQEADELVCLETPVDFYAVGQFYEDFRQVTDEEVTGLLGRAAEASA